MPKSNSNMIYKLQVALNSRGMKILCNRSQFYSNEMNCPITMYKIAQTGEIDPTSGRAKSIELFRSTSQIQCVLFLRNLWYTINDKEAPPTNNLKGAEVFEKKWAEFIENYDYKEHIEKASNNK